MGRDDLGGAAEPGVSLAAELLSGNDDVRPRAAGMLRHTLTVILEPVRASAAARDRLRSAAPVSSPPVSPRSLNLPTSAHRGSNPTGRAIPGLLPGQVTIGSPPPGSGE